MSVGKGRLRKKAGWLSCVLAVACRANLLLSQERHHHEFGRGLLAHAPAPLSTVRLTSFGRSGFLWTGRVHNCSSTQSKVGVRRDMNNTSRRVKGRTKIVRDRRSRMDAAAAGADAEGRGYGGGPRPKKRPLGFLCKAVNSAVLEMCVVNNGRPLARSMTDFVEYSIEALASGYSVEALLLELQLLDSTTRVPGETLTGVEKRYRTLWIGAMHAVMQNLNYMEDQEPKTAEEFHIKSQVDVVLRGRRTNDEQTFVKFDKSLATGGVSGGVATECIVVSPQMVPLSQLTLLAIRALQKLEDAAAA